MENWKIYHPLTLKVVAEKHGITVGKLLEEMERGNQAYERECDAAEHPLHPTEDHGG